MPLLKPVESPTQSEDEVSAGFVGFAERAIGYVMPTFAMNAFGAKKEPRVDTPRVGDYYVDYSGLTPEEADAPEDPAITALYNTSKPVSR
jgi:hypothetical protein